MRFNPSNHSIISAQRSGLKIGMDFRSENGCGKWLVWVWNRVRIWRTERHTPPRNPRIPLREGEKTILWVPNLFSFLINSWYFAAKPRLRSLKRRKEPLGWIWLLHLISVPPGSGLTFSSYPWRLAKIAFTPEGFHKVLLTSEEYGSCSWRIWVYPWRISWKLKLHPQIISYFFTLLLKKSSIFITFSWRIPWFLNRGVADIKCNSPLSKRAHRLFHPMTAK